MNIFFDPNNQFNHVNQRDAVTHNQLLLEWAAIYPHNKSTPLNKHMENCYHHPIFGTLKERTTLNEDLSYQYPGDPVQHPIFVVDFGDDCRFMIYQHAMVVTMQDGDWDIGRMD